MIPLSIQRWVELFRDVGLILGVPTLIAVGTKLYGLQAAALKANNEALQAQNTFLKETQYDRALSLIESQKKLYEHEREGFEKEIHALEQSGQAKEEQLAKLKEQVTKVSQTIRALDASRSVIQGVALDESVFQDLASFRYSLFQRSVDFSACKFEDRVQFTDAMFESEVDFSACLFKDRVQFTQASFKSEVSFDGAVLQHATFNETDLRGADLSQATIDEHTKLPKRYA